LPETDVRDLLQAGLHFGHQTRRWNPRMGRYIWGERDGIHIIDLMQTQELLDEARSFASEVAAGGGTVLFVGTKKQARDGIEEWARKTGMPYVNQRWLGGLLTNFHTISKRIERLHELDGLKQDGQLDLLPTKERMSMEAELEKLTYNLGGVRDMKRLPDAIVIIDVKTEAIGLREAEILRIPIIALVDSNVDPTSVSHPIPGNDDAIRSCDLVIRTLGEAIDTSATAYREAEAKRKAEEEERRRREEEEKRKREEAERARKEAEEAAAKEAEEKAKSTEAGAKQPPPEASAARTPGAGSGAEARPAAEPAPAQKPDPKADAKES
jgi:small subunit ribosomal protein S2